MGRGAGEGGMAAIRDTLVGHGSRGPERYKGYSGQAWVKGA